MNRRFWLIAFTLVGILINAPPQSARAQDAGISPAQEQPIVFLAVGDIGDCDDLEDDDTASRAEKEQPQAFAMLGDAQYEWATYDLLVRCYGASFGRFKAITYPVPGNHDIDPATGLSGFIKYFWPGGTPLDPGCTDNCRLYYSFDLGNWHIVALDTNCSYAGGCKKGNPQWNWLDQDLTSNQKTCVAVITHVPVFSSGALGGTDRQNDLFARAQQGGADLWIAGHDHNYEVFKRMNVSGEAVPNGIRSVTAGTGGSNLAGSFPLTPTRYSEALDNDHFGFVKLLLYSNRYEGAFISTYGGYTDYFRGTCDGSDPLFEVFMPHIKH